MSTKLLAAASACSPAGPPWWRPRPAWSSAASPGAGTAPWLCRCSWSLPPQSGSYPEIRRKRSTRGNNYLLSKSRELQGRTEHSSGNLLYWGVPRLFWSTFEQKMLIKKVILKYEKIQGQLFLSKWDKIIWWNGLCIRDVSKENQSFNGLVFRNK